VTRALGWAERHASAIIAGAFVLLALAAGALWWGRARERATSERYRAQIAALAAARDSARLAVARVDTVYYADTVRLRETVTRWRERAAAIDAAPPVVTARGDSVRIDTLAPVVALRLACDQMQTAAATALSTCEQRVRAIQALRVADSGLAAVTLADLRHTATAERRRASRQGFRRGAIVGALLTAGATVALRQLTR
jgi:hypothetical protein